MASGRNYRKLPRRVPNFTFGPRLFLLREKSGMTQEQLATKAAVTQATVCSFESGKNQPLLATAVMLAKALKISLDELVGWSDFVRVP